MSGELPDNRLVEVEMEFDDLAQVRERLERDGLVTRDDCALVRYLVYLGGAYAEAEWTAAGTASPSEAWSEVQRLYHRAGAQLGVLHFRLAQESSALANERLSRGAQNGRVAADAALIDRMERELALRRERIVNMKAALA